MKLAFALIVIGLAGTLVMLGAAANVGNWSLYESPWPFVIGIPFFLVFLYGYYRLRTEVRRRNDERSHRS